jgi:hypothetical protein
MMGTPTGRHRNMLLMPGDKYVKHMMNEPVDTTLCRGGKQLHSGLP